MHLLVLREGKAGFTRPLAAKDENLNFGNAMLSPSGDLVCAAFRSTAAEKSAYGILEIP